MYTSCFVCRRQFRRNTLIAHCPLGSRIAFEPATGRLWVVCHRCGQWCLVPLEQRWEAIEECEARFRDAPARVSTGHVGVADLGELTLVRVGEALRNEIANWRYGPRFRKRHKRRTIAYSIVVALMAVLFTTLAVIGQDPNLSVVLAAAFVGYAFTLRDRPSWQRLARVDVGRKKRTLRRWDLAAITLEPDESNKYYDVHVHHGGTAAVLRGTKAVDFLAAILPGVNRDGADEYVIRSATRAVDSAESALASRKPAPSPQTVWHRIVSDHRDSRPLSSLSTETLFALEMAVLEEQEQRIMAEEAARLAPVATSEAEIGMIADDMFTPAEISERLDRLRSEADKPKR